MSENYQAAKARKRLIYLMFNKCGLIQADSSGIAWVSATRCGREAYPNALVERLKARGFVRDGERHWLAEVKGHPGKWSVER